MMMKMIGTLENELSKLQTGIEIICLAQTLSLITFDVPAISSMFMQDSSFVMVHFPESRKVL
jgi:hypothetical protein